MRDIREQLRSPRVPPAVDRVILRVRELLLSRALLPGDKLPNENELAELFGVSRGSVREAMKVLASYGIVTIRAGDGTRVATENQGGLFDPLLFQMLLSKPDRQALRELRQLLELGMVPLLAAHAGPEDLPALHAALDRSAALVADGCTDADILTDADLAFHRALGTAAHNALVERIYGFVMDFLRPTVRDTYVYARSGDHGLATHTAILQAVEAGGEAEIRAAIVQSIDSWEEMR